LANQYLSTIDEDIREALLGNVNVFIVFRVGHPDDAQLLAQKLYRPTGMVIKDVHKEAQFIPGLNIAVEKKRFEKYTVSEEMTKRAGTLMDLPDRTFIVKHQGMTEATIDYTMNMYQPDPHAEPTKSYIRLAREIINRQNGRKKDVIKKEVDERVKEYLFKEPEHKRTYQ
jgi:hypothetical protein